MTVHHTPTPWRSHRTLIGGENANWLASTSASGNSDDLVAWICPGRKKATGYATSSCEYWAQNSDGNAAFIVRACNRDAVFEEILVAFAKTVRGMEALQCGRDLGPALAQLVNQDLPDARAALAKARETEGG